MSIIVKIYHKIRDQYLISLDLKRQRDKMRSGVNGYVLTKEQEQQARDYFAPYIKADLSAHNFYTEKTGKFYANYMPDDLHYSRVNTFFNDRLEVRFLSNKCLFPQLFRGVKQPVEVASRSGGLWFDGQRQLISRQVLDNLLAAEPEIVAKKASGSGGGKGVYFVAGKDFATVERHFPEDIVIQRPMQQHPDLAAINASSVNTVRVLSLLTKEGVKVYSSILRIGRNGSRVDNAGSGGVTCGITDDGKLKKYAYAMNGDRFEAHPDTGLPFEGTQVPGFDKCLEAVSKLHVQIPRFPLVSWDLAVDPDGDPVLIEANLRYGSIDIHQLNNGPLFGDDTQKILKMVFGEEKK